MTCIDEIPYNIMLSHATQKQCAEFVKKNTDEIYYVPGGYTIRGVPLVGGNAIPVGVSGKNLIFQFVKPCSGLYVLKIEDAQDEIERVRAIKK